MNVAATVARTAGDALRRARLIPRLWIGAGCVGISILLLPLFFLLDVTGRRSPSPTEYPQFFYGFLLVTMAWQIAFLIIGSDPVRFRLLMIPSIIEKFGYVLTLTVLYLHARVSSTDAMAAAPDSLLGILFVAAFARTPGPGRPSSRWHALPLWTKRSER